VTLVIGTASGSGHAVSLVVLFFVFCLFFLSFSLWVGFGVDGCVCVCVCGGRGSFARVY